MTISEGPASMSMPTTPNTSRFAAATYRFPGPTILSTARIGPAPNASAAIACAPPMVHTSSTAASFAAASTSGFSSPDGAGTVMTISATPATRAGMVFISTDDG